MTIVDVLRALKPDQDEIEFEIVIWSYSGSDGCVRSLSKCLCGEVRKKFGLQTHPNPDNPQESLFHQYDKYV